MRVETNKRWPKTVGYCAVFAIIGLETATLGPTLPGLAENTGTQLGEISFLFTAHALGYMGGSFLSGRLYDRMPGHPVMVGLLALMVTMLVLIPLVPALWLLAAAWLLLGVAGGGLDVGGNALIVWVYGREVGPYMNAVHFFFGVGSFLTPLIVALVLGLDNSSTSAYWVVALLVLPVILWLARLPSPRPQEASAGEGNGEGRADADGGRRIVILVSLMLALYVGAEAAFGGWIYTYALAQGLSDATTAAYLTSAFWGALMVGRLVAIPIAARFRPRWILLADLLGCLLSVGLLLLWPGSEAATWLGTMGLGFAMASIFPTGITLAERRIPITGQVAGWFLIGASLGAMSVPWVIGQLFEPVGPQITMVAILLTLVAALGAFGLLVRADSKPSGSPRP